VFSLSSRLRGPLLAAFSLFVPAAGMAQTTPRDDSFIAGYAAAILQREFGVDSAAISVIGGVVQVDAGTLASPQGERIRRVLSGIPGVQAVEVREQAPPTTVPPAVAPAIAPVTATVENGKGRVLPPGLLFEPLLADPRWPRFSAAYRYYFDDPDVTHAGAVSFGETFSLYRNRALGGQWEVGFQASVFSVFDLNSESADLINADYWVGVPVAFRYGNFSALGRIFHQSSHLGDEYLLRSEVNLTNRVNLSYEAVEGFLSYDIGQEFRVYGGAGYLFHRYPTNLDPWVAQGGVEYKSNTLLGGGALRPIGGINIQTREENDWDPEYSVRAGVQLEDSDILGRRIQILGEYYRGRNPNGQFYTRDLEYVGLGLSLQLE
jgi:hypothetical protein